MLKQGNEAKIEAEMAQFGEMFGFQDFKTTKGEDHTKDAEEGVFKDYIRQREYKQFMNKKVALARPRPKPEDQ